MVKMVKGLSILLVLVGGITVVVACGGSSSTDTNALANDGSAPGEPQGDSGGPGTDGSISPGGDGSVPSGDAQAPDADSGDGSPSCGGLRYCDDFESYGGAVTNGMTLGPWKASVAGATMTVDGVKPHAGAKSLHIVVAAGAGAHGTLNQTVAAGLVPGNDVFGRAMLFYGNTGGNGLPLAVHSWLFNASGNSTKENGKVTMNLGGGGASAKLQLNWHPVAPATEQSVQGGTMTAGAWHCVQWQYDGSGAMPKNDAKVWVDGTLAVEALPAKGWDFATPWSSFDFGFTHYQTLANGVDVYLDDFALNETMIACPK